MCGDLLNDYYSAVECGFLKHDMELSLKFDKYSGRPKIIITVHHNKSLEDDLMESLMDNIKEKGLYCFNWADGSGDNGSYSNYEISYNMDAAAEEKK